MIREAAGSAEVIREEGVMARVKGKPEWKKSNSPTEDDGCDRMREYLGKRADSNSPTTDTLDQWLTKLERRVALLESKPPLEGDPPPKPPDLGP